MERSDTVKAILVMDMPSSCDECDVVCTQYYTTDNNKKFERYMKPNSCPLKPMPEKQKHSCIENEFQRGAKTGYNACINDILKGSEVDG